MHLLFIPPMPPTLNATKHDLTQILPPKFAMLPPTQTDIDNTVNLKKSFPIKNVLLQKNVHVNSTTIIMVIFSIYISTLSPPPMKLCLRLIPFTTAFTFIIIYSIIIATHDPLFVSLHNNMSCDLFGMLS